MWLPNKDIAPWIVETVEEITTFPFTGHDDTVDAMTQALRGLYQKKKAVSLQLKDDRDYLAYTCEAYNYY